MPDKMSIAEWKEATRKKSYSKGKQTDQNKLLQKLKRQQEAKELSEMKLLLKLAAIPFVEEYTFHPEREWRFDIAMPEHRIAVEYEGINSTKSRHTSLTGYSKDCEKYNAAAALGWKVLRYTVLTYHSMIEEVRKILNL